MRWVLGVFVLAAIAVGGTWMVISRDRSSVAANSAAPATLSTQESDALNALADVAEIRDLYVSQPGGGSETWAGEELAKRDRAKKYLAELPLIEKLSKTDFPSRCLDGAVQLAGTYLGVDALYPPGTDRSALKKIRVTDFSKKDGQANYIAMPSEEAAMRLLALAEASFLYAVPSSDAVSRSGTANNVVFRANEVRNGLNGDKTDSEGWDLVSIDSTCLKTETVPTP